MSVRMPGTTIKIPKTSRLMDEFVAANGLNLLQQTDRVRVIAFLQMVKTKAPVLHMSFGVDPAPVFTQRLVTWLRAEIHPLVLLQVGLQPNIGAGCVVRATNKHFDFSLREHFKKQRPLLMNSLAGVVAAPAVAAVPAPTQRTPQVKEVEYAMSPTQPKPTAASEVPHG